MKKVLVSGLKGFVGSDLSILLAENYEVLEFNINVDMKADMFIHLAAKHPIHHSREIINSNINLLINILEYCHKNNIQNFVFFSSFSVYGQQDKENIKEINIYPNDFYGLSKLMGEKLLKESKMNVLCLRLPGILSTKGNYNYWHRLLKRLCCNQDIILTNYNKPFNSLISIDNIYTFIKNYNFKKKFELINCAVLADYNFFDLVYYLKSLLGAHSKIIKSDEYYTFSNFSVKRMYDNYKYSFDAKVAIKEWIRRKY